MEGDLDRDLERLRDFEADFADLDMIAVNPPETATCSEHRFIQDFVNFLRKQKRGVNKKHICTFLRFSLHGFDNNHRWKSRFKEREG